MGKKQYIFVFLILAGISIPALQQGLKFMKVRPLAGLGNEDTLVPERSFSWWDRGLQEYLEDYSTDSLSLRPACVRLRNQLEFSLFDRINAQDIYEHHGIFYRQSYPTYNEKSQFVGLEKIRKQVQVLADWQKKLGKDRVPVYVVITSSKLSYYRDELPWYNKTITSMTNREQYKKELERAGIAVLDADSWFVQQKAHTKIPLMARGGVHWTLYGGALVMDSLIRRIGREKQTAFQQVEMTISEKYQLYEPDNDGLNLANLMFPAKEEALRVVYFPEPAQPKKRLRPLVISDSFFNVVDWTPLHPQVLDPATPFYYYFKTRFSHSETTQRGISNAVFANDLEHADCVILITDIQNMHQFGFGLIEYLQ